MIHLTLKYPDIDFLKEEDDRVLVRNKFIQPLYLLSCLDIKFFFFFFHGRFGKENDKYQERGHSFHVH